MGLFDELVFCQQQTKIAHEIQELNSIQSKDNFTWTCPECKRYNTFVVALCYCVQITRSGFGLGSIVTFRVRLGVSVLLRPDPQIGMKVSRNGRMIRSDGSNTGCTKDNGALCCKQGASFRTAKAWHPVFCEPAP